MDPKQFLEEHLKEIAGAHKLVHGKAKVWHGLAHAVRRGLGGAIF